LRSHRSIGFPLAAAVLGLAAAGCGAGSPPQGPATATLSPVTTAPASPGAAADAPTGAGATTPAAVKTITVRIAGGKATPKIGRVEVARGAQVRLVVTSDVADEVHLHSYELALPLRPGKPATLAFTADKPGLFDVEAHETGVTLVQLLVR
jgi:hypothetical protein